MSQHEHAAAGDEPAAPSESDSPKVGFKNPPIEHQFGANNKFGKGRKKGSKGLKTMVIEASGQKVPVKMGGKEKKLSKMELTLHQMASKASKGDLKAADKMLVLYERYGPQDDASGPEPEKLRLDRQALRDLLAMMDLIDPEDDEGDNND